MKLLLCGDFACHSGFARVNEALAAELTRLGWEIPVLAVNYDGEPTVLQQSYRLYPAANAGDPVGVRRLAFLVEQEQPDAVLIVADPWMVRQFPPVRPPVVAYIPIDATGIRRRDAEPLSRLQHVVAYTAFGLTELRLAGMTAPASIIPHGVDLDVFRPLDRAEARARMGIDPEAFLVLLLDRNHARKRLDIAFEAFARFAEDKPDSVKLVYHGSLAERGGWAIEDMAEDLGILDRLLLSAPKQQPLAGVDLTDMPTIYGMCDVRLSTSSGEGWSLPLMEAMACGLPNAIPDHSAPAEWARDAAYMVPAPIPTRHAGGINTVGRVPLAEDMAAALEDLYQHPELRADLARRGLALVQRDCYRWATIAGQFDRLLRQAIEEAARDAQDVEPQDVAAPVEATA